MLRFHDYHCPKCNVRFEIMESHRASEVPCGLCGTLSPYVPGFPRMTPPRDAEGRVIMDDVRDIWEDTPLAGTDGINPAHYESKKAFVEMGK